MKFKVCFVIILVAFTPLKAMASAKKTVDLVLDCHAAIAIVDGQGNNLTDATRCASYLDGLIEGFRVATFIQTKVIKDSVFCLSDHVTTYQVEKMLIKYTDENPKVLSDLASVVVPEMLKEEFPCNK